MFYDAIRYVRELEKRQEKEKEYKIYVENEKK